MYYIAVTLYVLVCLLLMVVILLQQGKGGDIAAAFGGGASQTAFGARAGATVLTRATTVLAILFVIGAMILTIMGPGDDTSVVGGRATPAAPAPAATTPAPAPAPAAPPPASTTPQP